MNTVIDQLVKIFKEDKRDYSIMSLSDNIELKRDFETDILIIKRYPTIIHVTTEAYDVCNGREQFLKKLAEYILKLLKKPSSHRILIHRWMQAKNIIQLLNKNDYTQNTKLAYQFDNNIIILQFQIGGIAEEDGRIIDNDLDQKTIKPIKKGKAIPDNHIWASNDY